MGCRRRGRLACILVRLTCLCEALRRAIGHGEAMGRQHGPRTGRQVVGQVPGQRRGLDGLDRAPALAGSQCHRRQREHLLCRRLGRRAKQLRRLGRRTVGAGRLRQRQFAPRQTQQQRRACGVGIALASSAQRETRPFPRLGRIARAEEVFDGGQVRCRVGRLPGRFVRRHPAIVSKRLRAAAKPAETRVPKVTRPARAPAAGIARRRWCRPRRWTTRARSRGAPARSRAR
jgi:hypothetical protein